MYARRLHALFIVIGLAGMLVLPVSAQTLPPPIITAKGYAVYGWKNGVMTPLDVKNQNYLYPIASITKLITAKAVEELYPSYMLFAMTPQTLKTNGSIKGMVVNSQFTRDDLLKALLIQSSNDAAMTFMDPVGEKRFLATMNTILHKNRYTSTSFINPSGLDPTNKRLKPNRLTPFNLSRLLSDIYRYDPLLVATMNTEKADIADLYHHTTVEVQQSDGLYLIDGYKDKVIMGKTGFTNMAGENLAFITQGNDKYDYITIVILGSKDRIRDAEKILDWLDGVNQTQNFGG